MNIYILEDKRVGVQVLYNESDAISCLEFKELCDTLVKEFGNDIFILKEELIARGFKVAQIKCVYSIGDKNKFNRMLSMQ